MCSPRKEEHKTEEVTLATAKCHSVDKGRKCRLGRESSERRLLCQTSKEGVEGFGDCVVSMNNKWSPRREKSERELNSNSLTRSQAGVKFDDFLLLVGKFTIREKEER